MPPTTGKGIGQKDVTGLCGRSCSGTAGVDTVGVYEYDTKTGKVMATHMLVEGVVGDPSPSLDGSEFIGCRCFVLDMIHRRAACQLL